MNPERGQIPPVHYRGGALPAFSWGPTFAGNHLALKCGHPCPLGVQREVAMQRESILDLKSILTWCECKDS